MKPIVEYCCELCSTRYDSPQKAIECEKKHLVPDEIIECSGFYVNRYNGFPYNIKVKAGNCTAIYSFKTIEEV